MEGIGPVEMERWGGPGESKTLERALGWRRWVGEGRCHHSGMLSFASLLNKNIQKK